ncbi:unnamed protein product [Acanthoscelides obtectus]|uniref:Uncharacterized protein n=1 Tax=Acanthoscelides obtectus TaxID=200917 RepID=A0A9P0LC26_ACAOB|nr:unnamed protein product [Acanthoscelides obtectus]CAK1684193.1 Mycosubtilin synthase subunit C [Acanthoscelides obtectus]
MGTIPHLSIIKGPTRPVTPSLLHKLFENVAVGPSQNNTALIYKENDQVRQTTYSELNATTNKMARAIHQLITTNSLPRNKDGDYIIAVNMVPSDRLVTVLLAIWKAGAAYLPLDHAFPGPRIEHIVREAKPVLIIYDQDSPFYMDTYKISYDELVEQSKNKTSTTLADNEQVSHVKDDLAIVLYTSGSTGVPKGVRLPHRVIQNRLQWQFKRFPYSSTEKVCIFKTALTFVDSVSEIYGPLISGLAILVVPKAVTKDPQQLVALLEEYKIERLVLVPSLLRSLLLYLELQKTEHLLGNLRLWVCSGETLVVSLSKEFYKYFPENEHTLCNFYGSTEIMGDVTYYVVPGLNELKHMDKVAIGVPIDNTAIYLLDQQFRPVKSGDVGELHVSGLNLAAGYVAGRDPDKFVENPLAVDPAHAKLYRTGDFARIEKGILIYEGRTDSQVKVRGHRVDLSEVEKAVAAIEGIEKAVVLCYNPGEMNQSLLAFVTTNTLMSEHQIETILKEKLTSYMVPQVILLETIPLLVNGKTDRQALLKLYENTNNNGHSIHEVEMNYDGVCPIQKEAAKVLFETVASVLSRSARGVISVNSNFYEIGGNSLNSIYTISKLNEQGYHISIGDFISAMDLGEILLRMTSDAKVYTQPPTYFSEPLKPGYKDIATDMITLSFYHKADLEQWILSELSEADYRELIDAIWEPLLEKNLSFVVKSETGKIVGVALNFDARDEPEVEIKSKLTVIFEFLEAIEGPIRDNQLPPGKGVVLHAFMMATHYSLSPKENVAVMQFMEDEVLKLARERNFTGILTTNTSPLTQV